jgi:hypothetical protein
VERLRFAAHGRIVRGRAVCAVDRRRAEVLVFPARAGMDPRCSTVACGRFGVVAAVIGSQPSATRNRNTPYGTVARSATAFHAL